MDHYEDSYLSGHLELNPAWNFGKQYQAHFRVVPPEGRGSWVLIHPPWAFIPGPSRCSGHVLGQKQVLAFGS